MNITEKITRAKTDYDEVYDAGKQAEYDAFWDAAQNRGGKPYTCMYMFAGEAWNNETFKPKYDIVFGGTSHTGMFYAFNYRDKANPVDLIKVFKEQNIKFTGTMNWSKGFYEANISTLPTITMSSLDYMFYYCTNLKTIEKLILTPTTGVTSTSGAFTGCVSLENIEIEGLIDASISFLTCTKLTHDSLVNIINVLRDRVSAGITSTVTLTLGTDNLAKITDEEKAIATEKGWTLA